MIYLYRRWTDDYPRWRNTLGIATGLALIGFAFFPLLPPRLLDSYSQVHHLGIHYGFVDTLAKDPAFWSFNSGAVNKISNQFAAMPSVHCAWALWCACALVPRLKHVWAKVLAAIYPVMTVTVIVVTANHYFLDAVGGFFVFGVGYVLARIFTRAGRGPVLAPARPPTDPHRPDRQSLRAARWLRTMNPIAKPSRAEIAITRIIGALTVSKSQSTPTSCVFNSANTTSSATNSPTTMSLTLTLRPSSCGGFAAIDLPPLRARPYFLRGLLARTHVLLDQVAHAVAHGLVGERQLRVARARPWPTDAGAGRRW